jgi:hypothetical protein
VNIVTAIGHPANGTPQVMDRDTATVRIYGSAMTSSPTSLMKKSGTNLSSVQENENLAVRLYWITTNDVDFDQYAIE